MFPTPDDKGLMLHCPSTPLPNVPRTIQVHSPGLPHQSSLVDLAVAEEETEEGHYGEVRRVGHGRLSLTKGVHVNRDRAERL